MCNSLIRVTKVYKEKRLILNMVGNNLKGELGSLSISPQPQIYSWREVVSINPWDAVVKDESNSEYLQS